MRKFLLLKVLTVFLFLIFLTVGFVLAARKPLWTDEIYTQTRNIDQASYYEIAAGKIVEGNNCPLFYLLQKGICDLFAYKFPKVWDSREREVSDLRSQLILRIAPNFFTSLTLTILFYFFARYYSLAAGIYAVFVSLSSVMLWMYWVEARPYSLWIFLTILQSLFFILLARREDGQKRWWPWLAVTNILLSLTVLFGIVQTLIISALLYAWVERRWSKYLLMTLLPLGISLFYYFRTLKLKFFLPEHPLSLIFVNLPADRILILLIYAIILGILSVKRNLKTRPAGLAESRYYFAFTLAMFWVALSILFIFKLSEPVNKEGVFQLPHRYFLYLTPVMILAVTMCSIYIIRIFKGRWWMTVNSVIFLTGLLFIRILKTIPDVFNQRLY